jgi:hypothetical protein
MYYEMTTFDGQVIIVRMDGNVMTSFSENPENADWQSYQAWLAEGNTPEPWPPAE